MKTCLVTVAVLAACATIAIACNSNSQYQCFNNNVVGACWNSTTWRSGLACVEHQYATQCQANASAAENACVAQFKPQLDNCAATISDDTKLGQCLAPLYQQISICPSFVNMSDYNVFVQQTCLYNNVYAPCGNSTSWRSGLSCVENQYVSQCESSASAAEDACFKQLKPQLDNCAAKNTSDFLVGQCLQGLYPQLLTCSSFVNLTLYNQYQCINTNVFGACSNSTTWKAGLACGESQYASQCAPTASAAEINCIAQVKTQLDSCASRYANSDCMLGQCLQQLYPALIQCAFN